MSSVSRPLAPSALSNEELVAHLPALVQAERHAMVEVIEYLVEAERRRLYLELSASSLYRYCIDRLGYSEDAALKRHRVTKLALRFPQVVGELRAGTVNLTALFLLSTHLTSENVDTVLGEARGKSRRQVEALIAHWFPRPDVAATIRPLALPTCPETGTVLIPPAGADAGMTLEAPSSSGEPAASNSHASCQQETDRGAIFGRLEPLSPARVRVEFTARAELYDKVERTRQLLSHAVPSGDLGELFERALDALLEKETRKRFGTGKPRKPRQLKEGSRHIPVEMARAVWERDGAQCTFVDAQGRRCSEHRFLTIEHRDPFACGGQPTLENLCLLCSAHNQANARAVFGEQHVERKIQERVSKAA